MRSLSRYWQNKLIDWLPFPALREMRNISHVLHRSARKIIVEKKADLMKRGVDHSEIARKQRKDLMTIMREWFLSQYRELLNLWSK